MPANGYYEWKSTSAGKQPYFIYPLNGLFGFAGLLEYYEDMPNFTILTTRANALTNLIHDRMPVILEPTYYADWLNTSNNDNILLRQIAGQYSSDKMLAHEANKAVGNVKNEGCYLISKEQ